MVVVDDLEIVARFRHIEGQTRNIFCVEVLQRDIVAIAEFPDEQLGPDRMDVLADRADRIFTDCRRNHSLTFDYYNQPFVDITLACYDREMLKHHIKLTTIFASSPIACINLPSINMPICSTISRESRNCLQTEVYTSGPYFIPSIPINTIEMP